MGKNTSPQRRTLMRVAGAGAVACGAALLLPRACSSASYPQGSALAIEFGDLPQGKLRTVEWRGFPVWILRRSGAEIEALASREDGLVDPDSRASAQPSGCRNRHRSLRPDIFVAIGLCTHQGCTPTLASTGGFLCPCHSSRYDLAGRVFKTGPATANLVIPAYRLEAADRLVLGQDG